MITSLHNKEIKETAALLARKKERDRRGLFVVEGPKMFGEAPMERIERVYLAQSAAAQMYEKYGDRLSGLSCETVSDEVFVKMSDTKTPQGILCLVRQQHYNIEEILRENKEKQMLFIILEDIQDPGNLGTIFRTAEAAGADGVIMSSWMEEAVRRLQKAGVAVYAAHLGGTAAYDACDYQKSTAFLIGNEAKGLREETAACADARITIPMAGKVESLNAAVASSILLFEAARQRRKG